jgi:predicted transcriptional regulator
MSFRLPPELQTALPEPAEGISMQQAATQAITDYVSRARRRSRVSVPDRVMKAHGEALDRLGR